MGVGRLLWASKAVDGSFLGGAGVICQNPSEHWYVLFPSFSGIRLTHPCGLTGAGQFCSWAVPRYERNDRLLVCLLQAVGKLRQPKVRCGLELVMLIWPCCTPLMFIGGYRQNISKLENFSLFLWLICFGKSPRFLLIT